MYQGNLSRHVERVFSIVGHPEEEALPRPDAPIAKSWERCLLGYNLDPEAAREIDVLQEGELRQRRERLGRLFEIARTESANLFRQTAASGYAVLLTDAEGVIINYIGDVTLDDTFRQAGLWCGANWGEDREGTNGIGTAIVERRLVIIHRDEHFRARHTGLTCSGVPILDAEGRVAAVLDTSYVGSPDTRQSQVHAAALVNLSATFIENCHFLCQHAKDWVLHLHACPESVCLLSEPMLAIDANGVIIGANRGASGRLGQGDCRELIGRSITDVLEVKLAMMLKVGRSYQPFLTQKVRQVGQEAQFFVTLRPPKRAASVLTVSRRAGLFGTKPLPPRADCLTLRGLGGRDPRMAYNVRLAERVMNKDVSILLLGETGTGKEAFARAIHRASQRSAKPFIPVNCGSIPEALIESELFGYRHGAFTGARREGMRGKVLQADSGTLFLDEIGDMPPHLQTRLLRVLEEREVYPLGSDAPVSVDLHVVCATHRDLKTLVREGQFREDLYYRINAISLSLPPLRERCDKEFLIACALVAENDSEQAASLEESALARLMAYPWPGNIRELRNVLRTALALSDDGMIRLSDLPAEVVYYAERADASDQQQREPVEGGSRQPEEERLSPLELAEREAILRELERNHWNVSNTAAQLRMSRNTLYRRMKKYSIDPFGLHSI